MSIQKFLCFLGVAIVVLSAATGSGLCEQGPPPPPVRVVELKAGALTPRITFVGTVYFTQKADIASEVRGKVRSVNFEEGSRVKKGDVLCTLSIDLLERKINAQRETIASVQSQLAMAERSFRRNKTLYEQKTVSEHSLDEILYKKKEIENRISSMKADLEYLELELQKKTILADFGGVVVKKMVEVGEWIREGQPVARIANDQVADVRVNIPQRIWPLVEFGAPMNVNVAGIAMNGTIKSIIPSADMSTRTIPLNIRVKSDTPLVEGIEALASLPSEKPVNGFVLPREAVINKFGQDVIFTVSNSTVGMLPVSIVAFEGPLVGIVGQGLVNGTKVVLKGNERIQAGQPVTVLPQ